MIELPQKIVCVGLNYRDHAEEQGVDAAGAAAALREVAEHADRLGRGDPHPGDLQEPRLRGRARRRDRPARERVSRSTTRSTSCAATSSRTTSPAGTSSSPTASGCAASRSTRSCPVGDLVPASEVPDPQALPIRAILNGETMQDSNTSNQIFGVAEVDRVHLAGDHARAGRPDHHRDARRRRRVPQAAGLAAAGRRDHDRDRRPRLDLEPRRRCD